MGAFDDLIPKASASGGNPFADLIPKQGVIGQAVTGSPQASTVAGRVGTGMIDPVVGAAQLVDKLSPGRSSEGGGIQGIVKQREQNYDAARKAAGSTGFDWARTAGNIVSPANLALGAEVPVAGSLASRVGEAALAGGKMGLLTPDTGKNYAKDKLRDVAGGAAAGVAAPLIGGGIARLVKPSTNPEVEILLKEGVKLTPGQIAGGTFQRLEDAATSIPFVGDAIKSAHTRGIESFNKAAINRTLLPIGQRLPDGMKLGHEAIQYASDRLGEAYDKLLPKMKAVLDPHLNNELERVQQLGENLPKAQRGQLNRIIQNEVKNRFTEHGMASGETVKQIEEKLGKLSSDLGRSNNYDDRTMGDAVHEVQASVRRMVERVNPEHQGELAKVNKGWANLVRVQTAASRIGSKEGVFTPAQLRSAVKAADKSKGKSAFAKGKALMQDLSEKGSHLAQTIPDSGTTTRAVMNAALLGGSGMVSHAIPLAALVAHGAYTEPGTKAMQLLMTARPQGAESLANGIRNASKYLIPGAVAGANLPSNPTP